MCAIDEGYGLRLAVLVLLVSNLAPHPTLCVAQPPPAATTPTSESEDTFASRFQKWAAMEPAAAADSIEKAIKEGGGTPLMIGRDLLFLFEHSGSKAPVVVGDFNQWAQEGSFENAGVMQKIGTTNWYALEYRALPKSRFEYTFRIGMQQITDPNNPQAVMTFGSSHSLVELDHARIGVTVDDSPTLKGETTEFNFESKQLGNRRKIHVYLPPGYQADNSALPVMFVFDGDRWLENARLDAMIDKLIDSGELQPVIAVFVPPVNRALEYGGYSKFRAMMIEELVPIIRKKYQVSDIAVRNAVLGCSRGGLAALDLAFNHPDLFGFAAPVAPAIKPMDFLEELNSAGARPLKLAVIECLYDLDELRVQAQELRQILEEKEYEFSYIEAPGTHSYASWRHYVDLILLDWQERW